MTDIPVADRFNDPTLTNQQAKDAQDAMLEILRELPGGQLEAELTVATGLVTPTRTFHSIDTENDDPTDNLDNAALTNTRDGSLLYLRCSTNGRVITVRHGQTGLGEFIHVDSANIVLDDTRKWIKYIRRGNQWIEIARFFGNDMVAFRAFLGLGSSAILNSNATTLMYGGMFYA